MWNGNAYFMKCRFHPTALDKNDINQLAAEALADWPSSLVLWAVLFQRRNSVFLSQQISEQYFQPWLFNEANRAILSRQNEVVRCYLEKWYLNFSCFFFRVLNFQPVVDAIHAKLVWLVHMGCILHQSYKSHVFSPIMVHIILYWPLLIFPLFSGLEKVEFLS